MPREKIITGLDIGTSNIRFVVAKIKEGNSLPQIIGVAQVPSSGIRKGVVVDIEETVKSIQQARELVQRTAGIEIDQVSTNIGGSHICCYASKGVVAVSRADGEISEEDKNRAVTASSAISLLPNYEILHVLPRRFKIDNQEAIKEPLGLQGVRLEVDSLIIEGSTPFIKNLVKCVQEAGLENEGLLLSSLAASRAVLNKRQKELGVMVLDFGGGTTSLAVFEENDILHCKVLPVGSIHITNDIAIGLRTSVEVAERIKLEYGSVRPSDIGKKEMIDLGKLGEEGQVSRHTVAEIIEARVNEIFDLVNKELKKIDRAGLLPAGVVLCGGGAKLPGLVELAKEKLRLPALIGYPQSIEGVIDEVNDPSFATVCGLILSVLSDETYQELNLTHSFGTIGEKIEKKLKTFGKWLKNFLP